MEQTFISSSSDLIAQQYVLLLEKTNQQLSLWSNPYGILVGTLSILFTALTVGAAVILWRQSKEHKEAFREALTNYEKSLQENLNKIGLDAESKIQSFIDIKNKEIETLSGDAKKRTEEFLSDLKKEKDSISSRVKFSSVRSQPVQFGGSSVVSGISGTVFSSTANGSGVYLSGGKYCSNCGTYSNPPNSSGLYLSSAADNINFCQNCGNRLV